MIFGAHVSVAGGLTNAITRGQEIGADILQIFVSGPQSYRVTDYSDAQIGEFKKLYQSAGFRGLFLHAIYLINLASSRPELVERSKASIIHYMQMSERLGATGVIVHVGSIARLKSKNFVRGQLASREGENARHFSDLENRGLRRDSLAQTTDSEQNFFAYNTVGKAIKEIIGKTSKSQKFIIENCAGGKIGKDLDELALLHTVIDDERVAFCIDTQHLFASGVDVRDEKIFGDWLNDFDRRIGIDHLACIHANDSKSELGSNHDRHENIGEGKIGNTGFRSILHQPLLADKSFILEVPGREGKGPDRDNIEILRSLSN